MLDIQMGGTCCQQLRAVHHINLILSRVAKCHGYGGYIRIKNWKVGVKSLGEYTVLPSQVLFLVNLSNQYEILSSNQDYMTKCSAFVPQK